MSKQKENETTSCQEAEMERKPTESSKLSSIFTRYEDSIAALREFFSHLNPFVAKMKRGIKKRREADIKKTITAFGQQASKEELEELMNFLDWLKAGSTKEKPKVSVSKASDITSPLVGEFALKLSRLIFSYTPSDIHRELLNRSILLSLVSYFEVLVADLAHAFYRIAPDAVSTDDKVLSVNELKEFSSIDEALRSVVSHRVDELLWGTVNDWNEFFQSRMKVNMKLLVPNWAQWGEYFQRRHIILHVGGQVTERYLSNVNWEGLQPHVSRPSLGDKLDVDDAYLENAINEFEITGLLLCQEVWKKLVPEDSMRYYNPIAGRGLINAVYRRLLSRHWYVAERLAGWGEQDPEASEGNMLICKFNRWLCVKRQGRWTDVQEEVKAFDCSAKNRKYALVRASLLERADEFFDLLPAALSTEDITIEALKEWPILDEIRTDQRFAKVIEETKR